MTLTLTLILARALALTLTLTAAPRKEKRTGRRGVCPVRKGEDEMKRRDLKMGRRTSLPGR